MLGYHILSKTLVGAKYMPFFGLYLASIKQINPIGEKEKYHVIGSLGLETQRIGG